MSEIMSGRVPRSVDIFKTYTTHFVTGSLTSDGVQYSAVATLGTAGVEVLSQLIDPGVDMALQEIKFQLVPKFTALGTTLGSLFFYWRARQESVATTRAYIALCPTTNQTVSSAGGGSGACEVATLAGYIPITSLPQAPIKLSLMAQGPWAASFEAKVVNSSFVTLVGIVIPGA